MSSQLPSALRFPKLFSPLTLRGLRLPNRVVLTAMVTRLSGEDGEVNPALVERYRRFAQGGAGLIVVEATAVHSARSGPLLRLGEDRFIAGHKHLVDAAHEAGPGRLALQIIHFLKIARSGWRQTIDQLDDQEIAAVRDGYAAAAARARDAGYDAVELHMAHAYTLSSFLSRHNRRRDAWGGRSLEGRLRLPLETLAAVRRAVGEDFPVGLRYVGDECVKGGYGLDDAQQIGLRLAEGGADYLSLSAGGKFEDAEHRPGQVLYPYTGYSGERTMPPAGYPDACNSHLAAGVRRVLRAAGLETPVVSAGKIPTPDLAEALLAAGEADLIGLARPLLADPDWPEKARQGQEDRIIRCVYGNVCKALDENFRQVRCVLWPKGEAHPPLPTEADRQAPSWPAGARLHVEASPAPGAPLTLTWPPAQLAGARVYGYEVQQAVGDGPFTHRHSVSQPRFQDGSLLAGRHYRFRIRAYGVGGLRSAALESEPILWRPDLDPAEQPRADRAAPVPRLPGRPHTHTPAAAVEESER